MVEIYILPEMEVAGEEALREARESGLDEREQAVEAYKAMRAVFAMAILPDKETVH